MVKNLTVLIFLLFCGLIGRAQTPTIMAAQNHDSCLSHSFYYSYSGLSGPTTQYTLEHSFGDGTKDTFQVFQNTYSYFNYTYGTPGLYTAKAVLLQNNVRRDSAMQAINSGLCILFTGRVFVDFNSNCTFNPGADSLLSIPLLIKVDSAGIPIDTVQSYGHWAYMKQGGLYIPAVYTFTILNPPALFASTCQTANSITVNYPSTPNVNRNFGYTCAGSGFDLSGTYSAFLRASAAGPSWISGYYTNAGCSPQSGTVSFKVSPKYSITTAGIQPAPVSVSNNVITWNFSNLHVGATRSIYIPLLTNGVYTTSDTACNTMTINPVAGDANPANNTIARCDSLRTAFDPNDKSVSPSGNVLAGTTLTYHINFENLGNDTAFNIHILDTLSSNLDAASFQLLRASHGVRVVTLRGSTGQSILKFEFPNILLADKSKPRDNKGFVEFSMKTNSGLANGTVIPNRAGIYFDYNSVVMTNTAINVIGFPQSVTTLSSATRYTIHPNPATSVVTISNANSSLQSARLLSYDGRLVTQWNLVDGDNNLSIESLPPGLYLIVLQGETGPYTEKLEKR